MSKYRAILLLLISVLALPVLAQTQRVETQAAQSPAVIAERDVRITYGLTPEQVKELTKAAVAGAVGPLVDKI